MSKQIHGVAWSVLVALSLPPAAFAQGLETLGNRAAALAAFVAVADDASAVAWNPAGLVGGPLINVTLGLGRTTDRDDEPPLDGGWSGRLGTTLVALGSTPVGVAYYRISSVSLQAATPAVSGITDREQGRAIARTLVTSHFGATVQQSLGDHLTLGATLKVIRGRVAHAVVSAGSWDDAFDRAQALATRGSTRGDLDLGAMLTAGRVRAGMVMRNVTAPTFAAPDEGDERDGVTLKRHLRVGAAWADRWPGVSRTIVSVDADVTRVAQPSGARRDVAAGVEQWIRGQQVGLRAGIRASTVGEARPVVSGGGSLAVRAGMYLDAYVAGGGRMHRGWGVAARVSY
jgi:hypothetical protein